MKNTLANKQRGVALITAMIIATIAISIAGTVMYRQQIHIRLSSNIANMEQAYLYVSGMEDWAGTVLKRSYDDHPNYDSLEDDWRAGGYLITFPIDGGTINGQLFDLQARINVNSLVRAKPKIKPTPPGQEKPNPPPTTAEVTRQRLLYLIESLDPDQEMGPPENFIDILKDWIDSDQINGNVSEVSDEGASGNGAESPYYQSMEPAYFSANTLMVSTTELLLLKDMKKKIYKNLLEHVSTLPIKKLGKDVKTPININTAESEILKSIGLTPEVVEKVIEHRKETPFEKIEEFTNFIENDVSEDELKSIKIDIGVKTNYFLLKGRVSVNNASIPVNSILERKNGRISVIMRDFSNRTTIDNNDR